MDLKKSLVSVLLCLAIIGTGARAGFAQQVQPLDPEWLRQMYAEGWQKVQEGVLQRDTGGGEFETFSYGAEGLQWAVQRYEQRVADLKSRYDASPSEELAEIIDQRESEILRLEATIDSAPSAESVNQEMLAECAPDVGGEAFAEPQSGSPGVRASVNVYFHNECGYAGETSTTAWAHAVAATGEPTVTHTDPTKKGAWIDSHSSVSVSGSNGCHSWAHGTVMVNGEWIYDTFDEEYNCSPAVVDAGAPNGSDDTATLQGLLDAGGIVSLRPGQTYRLSQKLNITQSNSGIITAGTPAVLYLKSTFNNVEPLQIWDTSRVDSIAIRAEASLAAPLTNIRLENFKIEKQYLDSTYVTAIWLRGVKDSRIVGLDITGFALGPIVAIDSVDNVSIRGSYIHDSWATYVNSYAKFPQLTGIAVDDNKLSSSGQAVGSTRVTIAKNTISRLRFGRNLYNLQRGQFQGMSGTSPVGYQTDGIIVGPGGSGTVIVGNVIENVGAGIDCDAQDAVIRTNKIRDIFDWGVVLVHGAKNSLVEDNDIGAAGAASILVAGTTEASYGHTFGHLIRNNRITQVGRLSAFCGSAVPAPYQIFSTCPTTPSASAFMVIPNGGAGWPRYNLFSGNTVTAVLADARMKNLIRVDSPAEHSLFFGNSFSNQTGRTIGNQIQSGAVGTIIDPAVVNVVLADFNGDGRDDWFVSWKSSGQNYLYRQNSNGTFTRFDNLIVTSGINGSPDNLLSGDFNNDGYTDLLFHWKSAGTNRMYLSNALGSFDRVLDPMNVSNVGGNPDDALTGDFNGDGYTDIFFFWRQPGTNRFYYGGAGGAFSERLDPIEVTALTGTPSKVLVGNFDGGARSDLLFLWGDGTNRSFYGTGTGLFARIDDRIIAGEINGSPQTAITLDADRDEQDDVLFWWSGSELRRMYLGRADRTFLPE